MDDAFLATACIRGATVHGVHTWCSCTWRATVRRLRSSASRSTRSRKWRRTRCSCVCMCACLTVVCVCTCACACLPVVPVACVRACSRFLPEAGGRRCGLGCGNPRARVVRGSRSVCAPRPRQCSGRSVATVHGWRRPNPVPTDRRRRQLQLRRRWKQAHRYPRLPPCSATRARFLSLLATRRHRYRWLCVAAFVLRHKGGDAV